MSLSNFPAGYFPVAVQNAIQQYPGDAITQYVNGQNAYLYGFEVSYQQHLSYLPGILKGLCVSANYSYTTSQEKGVPLRTDRPHLIDQAGSTFNLSPTYDTKRLSIRAGFAYNGSSIFSYNYISPTLVTGRPQRSRTHRPFRRRVHAATLPVSMHKEPTASIAD